MAVIKAKTECIACMASLINISKHKRIIIIAKEEPRKDKSTVNMIVIQRSLREMSIFSFFKW